MMATLYVARSAKLCKWASDVGLGKHIYKVGVTDEDVKALVTSGWAGEADWQLVMQQPADGLGEEEALERLGRKSKLVDPKYYPRIRDAAGMFKVDPAHVENHILITKALAGEAERQELKLKPIDFAAYLIHNVTG
jgi:hypothetical protein